MTHAYRPIRKYSNIKNYQIDIPGDNFDTIIYNHNLRTEKRRRPQTRFHKKMVWGAAASPRNLARRAAFAGAGTLGAMATRGVYNTVTPWLNPWNYGTKAIGWQSGRTRQSGYYGRGFTGKKRKLSALNQNTELNFCFDRPKQEHKFFDTNIGSAAFVVAGFVSLTELVKIPVINSNAESERTGRKVTIRAINVNGHIQPLQSSSVTTATFLTSGVIRSVLCRVMLILDTQCNGALPSVANVLQTTDVLGFLNLENSGRFVILWNKVITVGHTAAAAGWDGSVLKKVVGGDGMGISYNKKCCIPIEYDNTASTGAVGTIKSNNLFWLFIANGIEATYSLKTRIRFTD